MQTRVITGENANRCESSLHEAAAALRDGALVVFPTETVYGVAANAANADAVKRLRKAKGRGFTQPFTVHLSSRAEAQQYVSRPPALARRLSRKAWPGPVTLICPAGELEKEPIAQVVSADGLGEVFSNGKVGLRCPDHALARELIRQAGVPVVASSANRAGKPPPVDLRDALRDLDGVVEFAFDGGRTRLSAASTIVEITPDNWVIQRQGAIDERTIRRMVKSVILMVCTGNSCRSPLAEYMFRAKLAERLGLSYEELAAQGYAVVSAGTLGCSGLPISDGSCAELAARGIDAATHRSQPLTIELVQQCERIYCMSGEHRLAVLDLLPAAADRVFPWMRVGRCRTRLEAGRNSIGLVQRRSRKRSTRAWRNFWMKIAIGSDHRGFDAKERVKAVTEELGITVIDHGADSRSSCDYPAKAFAVAHDVANKTVDLGILLCGSGLGMSIVANKVRGVRAALCHDELTAQLSRRHNDANILCLPADLVGDALMQSMVRIWLQTEFEGGRHKRRVEQIEEYERAHIANHEPSAVNEGA